MQIVQKRWLAEVENDAVALLELFAVEDTCDMEVSSADGLWCGSGEREAVVAMLHAVFEDAALCAKTIDKSGLQLHQIAGTTPEVSPEQAFLWAELCQWLVRVSRKFMHTYFLHLISGYAHMHTYA